MTGRQQLPPTIHSMKNFDAFKVHFTKTIEYIILKFSNTKFPKLFPFFECIYLLVLLFMLVNADEADHVNIELPCI